MTEHNEAIRLAEKHGARVARAPEPFPNAVVMEPAQLSALISEVRDKAAREQVAQWMIGRSIVTGHGDTLSDLLETLVAEVRRDEREKCAQECDELGQSDGVSCAKELRIGLPATHQYHCANSSCSGPEWFGVAKQSQAGTYIDCPRCGHPADVEPIRAKLNSPTGKEK